MKIKRQLLMALALISCLIANAQQPTLNWAKSMGGIGLDEARGLVIDAQGNVIACGSFSGTVDFDPGVGTFTMTAGGSRDAFISKFDPTGNFIWAKQILGSPVTTNNATGIALDNLGNIYTTGYFGGIVDFDPSMLTYSVTSLSASNIFILKLDGSGNFIWVAHLPGIANSGGTDITIDNCNNIYTTGFFSETVDFNPSISFAYTLAVNSATATNMFICKLNSNSNFLWAVKMGGYNVDRSNSIALDANKNVYTTGNTYGTSNLGDGFYAGAGFNDLFLCKRDSLGTFIWARKLGSPGTDKGHSVDIDQWGNAYLTGSFTGTLNHSGGSLISYGAADILICKYNPAGNLTWIKNIGGTSNEFGYCVSIDNNGNPVIAGTFQGAVDFDPGPSVVTATSNGGLDDIFFAKYDSSCVLQWLVSTNALGNEAPTRVLCSGQSIFSVGAFFNTIDFNPGPGVSNLISNGNADAYVVKLNETINGIEINPSNLNGVHVFPIPFESTITVDFKRRDLYRDALIAIYTSSAQKVFETQVRIQDSKALINVELTPGIYYIHIYTPDNKEIVHKLIKH